MVGLLLSNIYWYAATHIEDQASQVEKEIKTSQMTDDRMKVGDMSEAVLDTLAPATIVLQPLQIIRERPAEEPLSWAPARGTRKPNNCVNPVSVRMVC